MKLVKRSFVVFIAMLLLVTCSGVVVMIHTCLGTKKTEISLTEDHKCCGKKKQSADSHNIEKKCCNVDYQYHKLSVLSVPADDHDSGDIAVCETILFNTGLSTFQHSIPVIVHSPPVLSEDIILSFRQLLI